MAQDGCPADFTCQGQKDHQVVGLNSPLPATSLWPAGLSTGKPPANRSPRLGGVLPPREFADPPPSLLVPLEPFREEASRWGLLSRAEQPGLSPGRDPTAPREPSWPPTSSPSLLVGIFPKPLCLVTPQTPGVHTCLLLSLDSPRNWPLVAERPGKWPKRRDLNAAIPLMPEGELAAPSKCEHPNIVGVAPALFSTRLLWDDQTEKTHGFSSVSNCNFSSTECGPGLQAGREGLQWLMLWHFPSRSHQFLLPEPCTLPCIFLLVKPSGRGVRNASLPDVCDDQLHATRKYSA